MARMTKQEKNVENAVDKYFKIHGNNIQFNIMDLGKIHSAGVNAGLTGGNIEQAVINAIEKYRVKELV